MSTAARSGLARSGIDRLFRRWVQREELRAEVRDWLAGVDTGHDLAALWAATPRIDWLAGWAGAIGGYATTGYAGTGAPALVAWSLATEPPPLEAEIPVNTARLRRTLDAGLRAALGEVPPAETARALGVWSSSDLALRVARDVLLSAATTEPEVSFLGRPGSYAYDAAQGAVAARYGFAGAARPRIHADLAAARARYAGLLPWENDPRDAAVAVDFALERGATPRGHWPAFDGVVLLPAELSEGPGSRRDEARALLARAGFALCPAGWAWCPGAGPYMMRALAAIAAEPPP